MRTDTLPPADLKTWVKGLIGCAVIGCTFWLLATGHSYLIWYLAFLTITLRLGVAILRLLLLARR